MDNEEFRKQCLARLGEFIEGVKDDTSDLSVSILTTMTQFIFNCRIEFNRVASQAGREYITRDELLLIEIQELRQCIIDLTEVLNRKDITQ